jgi:hypothetical protein
MNQWLTKNEFIFSIIINPWTNTQNNRSNQSCEKKHRTLCYEYKNAISLEEVDVQYVTIYYWWYFSMAVHEVGLQKLEYWLNFWHFHVR